MPITALLEHGASADWVLNTAYYSMIASLLGWTLLRLLHRQGARVRSSTGMCCLVVPLLVPGLFLLVRSHRVHLGGQNPQAVVAQEIEETRLPPVESAEFDLGVKHDVRTTARTTPQQSFLPVLSTSILVGALNLFGLVWMAGLLLLAGRVFHGLALLDGFRKATSRPRRRATRR